MTRSLRIIRPDPSIHREAIYDLLGKSFSDYWREFELCRDGYIEASHYDWSATRIGLVGDEVVSHFGVWEYAMRVGTDSVRVGGIGGVCTDRNYRNRGFMKETAEAGIDALAESQYGVSILFGISDFYHRFGYVSAWNGSTVTISARDISPTSVKVRLRKLDSGAERSLDAISNRTNAGLTGTAVRPTYGRNREPGSWQVFHWQSGSTRGYVIVAQREGRCELVDSGGAAKDILAACSQLLRRFACTELVIHDLHRHHPLFQELKAIKYTRVETNTPTGGAMVRVVDATSTITSMSKTIMRRLRESAFSGWAGVLVIQFEREPILLQFSNRGLKILGGREARESGLNEKKHRARVGPELAQFIIGSDDPYRIIEGYGIKTTGDAKGLLCALFPEQFPTLGRWDQM